MNQILFSRQIRSDTPLASVGIVVVFGLAVAAAAIAAREGSLIATVTSAILFFIGLRAMTIYFHRRSFSFVVGSETIEFGPVHKPKQQTQIETKRIVRAHWSSHQLELDSGEKVQLPLHTIKVAPAELRAIFELHLPQIDSID